MMFRAGLGKFGSELGDAVRRFPRSVLQSGLGISSSSGVFKRTGASVNFEIAVRLIG
jgi:hypothetical protein